MKKSSTNFCMVPLVESSLQESDAVSEGWRARPPPAGHSPGEEDLRNGLVRPLARRHFVVAVLVLVYRLDQVVRPDVGPALDVPVGHDDRRERVGEVGPRP